jgi:hypothetical protein
VPFHPGDLERLAIQSDCGIGPIRWLNAKAEELVTAYPPIARGLADVACFAQVSDINASCLFYGSATVCAASPQILGTALIRHGYVLDSGPCSGRLSSALL